MVNTTQTEERPEIRVRKPAFHFGDVPRHWLFGNARASHLANALNLVFPLGERFFIRSVRHYIDRIDDPALLEDVKRFMGQEVRHGMEHERYFEVLEGHGLEIASFLEWYERVAYQKIEKACPPALNLSATVALEHFTAMFAERALTRDILEQHAHPAMRDLLLWHACEELEHKAVAFDVLKKVNPSYALRVAGLAAGAAAFVFFWLAGTRHLMKQEPREKQRMTRAELADARKHNVLLNGEFARAFVDYLRPDFHPAQNDNYHLAREWLSKHASSW
jgi:uncharacterized protein